MWGKRGGGGGMEGRGREMEERGKKEGSKVVERWSIEGGKMEQNKRG